MAGRAVSINTLVTEQFRARTRRAHEKMRMAPISTSGRIIQKSSCTKKPSRPMHVRSALALPKPNEMLNEKLSRIC